MLFVAILTSMILSSLTYYFCYLQPITIFQKILIYAAYIGYNNTVWNFNLSALHDGDANIYIKLSCFVHPFEKEGLVKKLILLSC